MNDNDKVNKKCLRCVHCKVCEHIDDGIQMCCSGWDGCEMFEDLDDLIVRMPLSEFQEKRLNLSDRIKLANKVRNKTVEEFAEKLRKEAKPLFAANSCFVVDVAEISAIKMQMLIDIDKKGVIE